MSVYTLQGYIATRTGISPVFEARALFPRLSPQKQERDPELVAMFPCSKYGNFQYGKAGLGVRVGSYVFVTEDESKN